ncbi:MAG: hypothetical protein AABX02_04220 [archaeon]
MIRGQRATDRGYRAAKRRTRGERSRNFRAITQPGETPLTARKNIERAARHVNTTTAAAFRLVTRALEPNRKPSQRTRTFETESATGVQHQIASWTRHQIFLVNAGPSRELNIQRAHSEGQIDIARRIILQTLHAYKIPEEKALRLLSGIERIINDAAQEWENK